MLTYSDVYEGEYRGDKFNGVGRMTYGSGDVYEGEFKDGRMHGRGKCMFVTGDLYEGTFADDQIDGDGKFTYANGDLFEGEWELDDDDVSDKGDEGKNPGQLTRMSSRLRTAMSGEGGRSGERYKSIVITSVESHMEGDEAALAAAKFSSRDYMQSRVGLGGSRTELETGEGIERSDSPPSLRGALAGSKRDSARPERRVSFKEQIEINHIVEPSSGKGCGCVVS